MSQNANPVENKPQNKTMPLSKEMDKDVRSV